MKFGQQIEAPQGETLQLVLFDNGLQRCVDVLVFRHGIVDRLDRYFYQLYSQTVFHPLRVSMAGDEPVGRLPDDTQPAVFQLISGLCCFLQHLQPSCDVLRTSVNNLPRDMLLSQE